jgi:hypothetical protein
MDSLDCSQACVSSALLGSPSATTRWLFPSHPCCYSPQVPCMFGVSNPVHDDQVPIPCLRVPFPRRPSARAAAALLANSDDEVCIPHVPPCSVTKNLREQITTDALTSVAYKRSYPPRTPQVRSTNQQESQGGTQTQHEPATTTKQSTPHGPTATKPKNHRKLSMTPHCPTPQKRGATPSLFGFRVIVMTRFLFLFSLCFLTPSPLPIPFFTLTLPCRLVAAANALLVNIDVLLLLRFQSLLLAYRCVPAGARLVNCGKMKGDCKPSNDESHHTLASMCRASKLCSTSFASSSAWPMS